MSYDVVRSRSSSVDSVEGMPYLYLEGEEGAASPQAEKVAVVGSRTIQEQSDHSNVGNMYVAPYLVPVDLNDPVVQVATVGPIAEVAPRVEAVAHPILEGLGGIFSKFFECIGSALLGLLHVLAEVVKAL